MKKFDLLRDKPELDVPTLNWVWDILWRKERCMRPKNADRRSRKLELEAVMAMLESEAAKAESEG